MKEAVVAATEFRAKCLKLLDEIAEQGNSLVITKRGRPIAKVVPVAPRKSLRGSWKGKVKIKGDIVYFSTADDWEAAH